MQHMPALEAKTHFGRLLDTAQREPVTIEKHGRAVAVVISTEEYLAYEEYRRRQLVAELQLGVDDIQAGKVVDGEELFASLRARLTK